jgi:hypothetical protein
MSAQQTFIEKVKVYGPQFNARFGLKDFQGCGPFGNMGRETGGFTQLREIAYLNHPGVGGYGWLQWTGPRARAYLNWCAAYKLDWRSDPANFGYLIAETASQYAYVIEHLKECTTLEQAVEVWERLDERAGVVAMNERIAWGKIALQALQPTPRTIAGPIGSAVPPEAQA